MCNQLTPSSSHFNSCSSLSDVPLHPKIMRCIILAIATLTYVSFIVATVGFGYISWPIQLLLIATSVIVCSLFLIFKLIQSCANLKPIATLSGDYPFTPSKHLPVITSRTLSLDSLTFRTVGNRLRDFQKISAPAINSRTTSVTLQGPNQLLLHFQKGHPFDDPFLSANHSALLLTTNSDGNLSLSTGRTLSVSGSIHKDSWSVATQQGIPIGHCTSAFLPQENTLTPSRAYAIILINPPTVETLIPEAIRCTRRAITLQNFALSDSFHQLVQAYSTIFSQCRHLEARSVQLEILGIQDFPSTHEQYSQWEAFCHLALLEALHTELNSGLSQLQSITINDRHALPMRHALSHRF